MGIFSARFFRFHQQPNRDARTDDARAAASIKPCLIIINLLDCLLDAPLFFLYRLECVVFQAFSLPVSLEYPE